MNKDNNTIVRADISSILKRSGIAEEAVPETVLEVAEADEAPSADLGHSSSDREMAISLRENAMRSLQQEVLPAILDKYKDVKDEQVISLREELGEEAFKAYFKELPLEVRSKLEKSDMRMTLRPSTGVPVDPNMSPKTDEGLRPKRGKC